MFATVSAAIAVLSMNFQSMSQWSMVPGMLVHRPFDSVAPDYKVKCLLLDARHDVRYRRCNSRKAFGTPNNAQDVILQYDIW